MLGLKKHLNLLVDYDPLWELVLLRHKEEPLLATLLFRAAQHGQRGKLRASATAIRLCRLAIEFATWRSGRIGGASGSVTSGNGRFFEPRGEGRS